jgi:hypothetical protein
VSLEHSLYAVYGVELVGADWLAVDEGLEELRRTRAEDAGSGTVGEDVQLLTVHGSRGPARVVIGFASEELPPGACRMARDFTPSPERDEVLRAAAASLGCRMLAEPGWLIVHDWS